MSPLYLAADALTKHILSLKHRVLATSKHSKGDDDSTPSRDVAGVEYGFDSCVRAAESGYTYGKPDSKMERRDVFRALESLT